jgi:hypothetical protein
MADTDANVPYVMAYGNITKVLERIRTAQAPPRFSTDFLGTTLNLSGGSARPLIPFLKRTGFLGSDGTPTDLYKQFRNPSHSGQAAAKALRIGYANLYRVNEYLHDATEPQLKGIVVQVTGSEPSSSTVQAIVGSFKALKAFANFSQAPSGDSSAPEQSNVDTTTLENAGRPDALTAHLRLGYTINLNLPATSDIAVFDAIFKSLREHLL